MKNTIHRDIKPGNILLSSTASNFKLVLADFGLSAILNTTDNEDTDNEDPDSYDSHNNSNNTNSRSEIVGTEGFMAPEVECGLHYSYPADLWSVGITFQRMFAGFERTPSTSEEQLLNLLLDHNPLTRTTAANALLHPYFQGFHMK